MSRARREEARTRETESRAFYVVAKKEKENQHATWQFSIDPASGARHRLTANDAAWCSSHERAGNAKVAHRSSNTFVVAPPHG
jgi:hypothetical protein